MLNNSFFVIRMLGIDYWPLGIFQGANRKGFEDVYYLGTMYDLRSRSKNQLRALI